MIRNSKTLQTVGALRNYNLWRRGDENLPQPDPREIGRAIDHLCEEVERLERDKLVLLKLIGRRDSPSSEESDALLNILTERDGAINCLFEVEERMTRLAQDLEKCKSDLELIKKDRVAQCPSGGTGDETPPTET